MNDLIAQVKRIPISSRNSLAGACEKIGDFPSSGSGHRRRLTTPSRGAANFIDQFFQKTGWIFGALIMGSVGYILYHVVVMCFAIDERIYPVPFRRGEGRHSQTKGGEANDEAGKNGRRAEAGTR